MNPDLYEIHEPEFYWTESMRRGDIYLSTEPIVQINFFGMILGLIELAVWFIIWQTLLEMANESEKLKRKYNDPL